MLQQLGRWIQGPCRRATTHKAPGLRLELLEDRLAPAIFNVDSLADILNPPAGVVTLRSAIQAANAAPITPTDISGGNIINLTVAGTYTITIPGTREDNNATGDFDIIPNPTSAPNTFLLIQNTSGGNVVVDGNHLDRVFDINPGNTDNPATKLRVFMQGFTIQNGLAQPGDLAAGSGGGIRDQGNANLTLTDMVVTANAASADGGGIAMENSPASTPWTLTLNNTTISNNHAGDAGGGIETDGKGKVFVNAGSVLSGNTTVNQGAAVWLDAIADGVASVTITNPGIGYVTPPTVTFSVPRNAGGTTATGTATITAGAVTSVTITNPGSGYTAAPTVTFSAPPAGLTATGTANLGFSNSAALTVTGSLISGNSALNGPTGAIGNAGNGAVVISSSTVANNFSGTTGGGFGDENNLGTLTVSGSLFENNSALGNGGGIQEGGPNTIITSSVISGNSTNASGGGIFANGVTLTVLNSTVSSNSSAFTSVNPPFFGGGGVEVQTTGTGASASSITNTTIVGNSVLNNAGNNNGGGIDASASFTGALALLNDTITGNNASSGGGVFWAGTNGSTFNVRNTIIAGNIAGTGPDANNPAGTFTDNGGNAVGISGAGSGNTGFTNATTQTGTPASPLKLLLGPLQNNNGPLAGAPTGQQVVPTEALLPGSPAIGKGVASGAPTSDERGFVRPGGGNAKPSVGAFEPESPAGASANQVYVENLYEFLLGRAADPGAEVWVNILTGGSGTNIPSLPSVVAGIESSAEYRTDLVQGLYRQYLHRSADATGLKNFVDALNSGQTVEQVAAIIVGSAEYFALHGNTEGGFLAALYEDVLNRMVDPGAFKNFSQALVGGGTSRSQVAAMLFASTEYQADLVQSDYQLALERPADAAGLIGFVNALQQQGATDQAILARILGSPEGLALRS
jgi:hypothetical protein